MSIQCTLGTLLRYPLNISFAFKVRYAIRAQYYNGEEFIVETTGKEMSIDVSFSLFEYFANARCKL